MVAATDLVANLKRYRDEEFFEASEVPWPDTMKQLGDVPIVRTNLQPLGSTANGHDASVTVNICVVDAIDKRPSPEDVRNGDGDRVICKIVGPREVWVIHTPCGMEAVRNRQIDVWAVHPRSCDDSPPEVPTDR
jgi:hypothetical protein